MKKRRATAKPATSQRAITPRLANSNPSPAWKGLKAACIVVAKWRMGKTSAKVVSQVGASLSGMNTSEMNMRGRMEA